MKAFHSIFDFVGIIAIILGGAVSVLNFLTNFGSEDLAKSLTKAVMVGILFAYLAFLIGSVIFQIRNNYLQASEVLVTSGLIALPAILTFIAWAFTGNSITAELVFGLLFAFILGWVLFTLFAFIVMFIFPRILGFYINFI